MLDCVGGRQSYTGSRTIGPRTFGPERFFIPSRSLFVFLVKSVPVIGSIPPPFRGIVLAAKQNVQLLLFSSLDFLYDQFPVSTFQTFHPLFERLHNGKDASTFVLMFCPPFIPHNSPIHLFGFIYYTMKPTSMVYCF